MPQTLREISKVPYKDSNHCISRSPKACPYVPELRIDRTLEGWNVNLSCPCKRHYKVISDYEDLEFAERKLRKLNEYLEAAPIW
jgi:hypothetical protein